MDPSLQELLELIRLTERVSADIHGLRDKAGILKTVVDAFRGSKRFHAHIMMLDEERGELGVAATSFSPAIVKLGEKIAGVSMATFRLDPGQAPLMARVLHDRETIQIPTMDSLADLLPAGIAKRVLQRLNYEGTVDILTPLHVNGRPTGLLSVTAPGLAEHFIPSLKNLAHHISSSLELADAIRETEAAHRRYRDLVENLNEIIYTVDMTGIITYISPNVSDVGLAPEDLVGESFVQAFEGEHAAEMEARFSQYLSGELTSGENEYRLRGKDGLMHWIRISSRIAVEDGQPKGLRGSIVDVTKAKTAETALKESERVLNQTGRMARIGGWEHDIQTGEAVWTRELFNIIEIDPKERPPGVGAHLEYYPPADRAKLEHAYNLAMETGQPFDLELVLNTARGRRIWCRAYGEPVFENGKCIKMRGTFQDIDEAKRVQLARNESERRLETLMSNLPGMAYRCRNEPEWTMEFVSDGSLELTGYRPDDLIENRIVSFGSLIEPEDRQPIRDAVQQALAEHRSFAIEYRIRTADGTRKWVWEQGQGVFDGERGIDALEGFITDVTSRRDAEEALRVNKERLELALDSTSDGLWEWNTPDGEMYVSPRCYRMLGYAPYEFPPTEEGWNAIIHPEERDSAMSQLREHANHSDERFETEFRMRARDGSWRWIRNRGRVVAREQGRAARLIGTYADITAQKEAAAALRQALDGTILAVARTVELRDPYTSGHQERVARLACAIAEEMGLLASLGQPLHVAGLLHDVGKISVPSEILSKPARLNDVEMHLVQGHVEASYRILEGIDFPWPIAEMVLQHHERLDGSGYPQGLRAEDISQGARILAVADVVEAIASHRPYRPALGIDAALTEIEAGKDSLFDRDAVDACIRLFRDRGLTFDSLAEVVTALEPGSE